MLEKYQSFIGVCFALLSIGCGPLENAGEVLEMELTGNFYVHDSILTNGSYGVVVGKSPKYEDEFRKLMDADPSSYDELLKARREGTRKLKPDEPPKEFCVERTKKIPHIFIISDGLTVVSEPMKAIIESLDPNIHQFFPIKIIDRRGKETVEPNFLFHFYTHKRALVEGQAAIQDKSYNGIEYTILDTVTARNIGLKLRASSLQGAHFWRSEEFPKIYFVSDEFLEAVKSADLPFYKTYPTEIVSEGGNK